jgi:hypothetical protein
MAEYRNKFIQIEVSTPNTKLQNSGGPQIFIVTAGFMISLNYRPKDGVALTLRISFVCGA